MSRRSCTIAPHQGPRVSRPSLIFLGQLQFEHPGNGEELSMRIGARVVTRLVGFLLACSALALAQNATTSLRGTVYDAKGAVVAGAAVTLSNPATGFSHTSKSDGQGNYQFLELPAAKSRLLVNAPCFAEMRTKGFA